MKTELSFEYLWMAVIYGFDLYDYGVRYYAAGRWRVIDHLWINIVMISYTYCVNNPMKYIDSDWINYLIVNKMGQVVSHKVNRDRIK